MKINFNDSKAENISMNARCANYKSEKNLLQCQPDDPDTTDNIKTLFLSLWKLESFPFLIQTQI